MPDAPPPAGFDPAVPNVARVWDYWLGGHVNYDADRAAAEAVEAVNPAARTLAIQSRRFLARAVTWAAEQGVTQFIDLGAGIPTRGTAELPDGRAVRIAPVHEIAREANPGVTAAYVDRDEVAVAQTSALLAGDGVAAVLADLRDPAAVLGDPGLRAVIDLTRPACVLLASVLHLLPGTADTAARVVAGYAGRVAPGSYVVISEAVSDPAVMARISESAGPAGPVHAFTLQAIVSLMAGLEVVEPGVVPARYWRRARPVSGPEPRKPYLAAAVGRVP